MWHYAARPDSHRTERAAFERAIEAPLLRVLEQATEPRTAADLGRAAAGRELAGWERLVVIALLEAHGAHYQAGLVIAVRLGQRPEWGYCRRELYERLQATGRIGRRQVATVQTLREYVA